MLLYLFLESGPGISFWIDQELGTSEEVFAIMGPHHGDYGNLKVAVVFDATLMRHPDSFILPVTAVGYHKGWYCEWTRFSLKRPWCGESLPLCGAIEQLHQDKLNCGIYGWAQALALELAARVSLDGRIPIGNVTVSNVQEWLRTHDSHTAPEGHLPGIVALDHIEKVFISTKVTTSEVEKLRRELGDRIAIVPDVREASSLFMNTKPPSPLVPGFAFTLCPLEIFSRNSSCSTEVLLPLEIPELGLLSFIVSGGGDLAVVFSDNVDPMEKRRNSTILLIRGTVVTVFSGAPPLSSLLEKRETKSLRFTHAIKFHVYISKKKLESIYFPIR